ncbi:DNA polymerase beta superfamily protein [Pseudalkalibacillus hwajinpoensis]|uniref:Nucleotidyltransferase domain-containing protein n=1 Tax=Guptibacillus hwajinpoensis TaxID=208199 RepID=A0A4U1MKX5_9BACL|nr:nucleotidyltransferase domain-containing protein [Pseudalkalibacillus hwajinpoensis]TKD71265.1 nucleotidyltransferase domain-containing protein [Pseudalkalibacillus hwajinpoensis]
MIDLNAQIKAIEMKRNIKVLYACDNGSRAFGYETDESDYDIRFIYSHPSDWYLSIYTKSDVLEVKTKNIEMHGWDIRKALQLLTKSNPSLHEWLASPVVYRCGKEVEIVRELAKRYFSSKTLTFHYVKMGHTNLKTYEQQKKQKLLLYSLKSVLYGEWIYAYNEMPSLSFQDLVNEFQMNTVIHNECLALLARKTLGNPALLISYIQFKLDDLKEKSQKLGSPLSVDYEEVDRVFRYILSQ